MPLVALSVSPASPLRSLRLWSRYLTFHNKKKSLVESHFDAKCVDEFVFATTYGCVAKIVQ